jgi:hypothetical protein
MKNTVCWIVNTYSFGDPDVSEEHIATIFRVEAYAGILAWFDFLAYFSTLKM